MHPIEHPAAWSADDLRRDQSWILSLDGGEKTQALAALSQLGATALGQIDREIFPLGALGRSLDALIDEIEGGRGVALIRGVPIEELALEEVERLFWGLSAHLCYPEAQDRSGKRLHHVRAERTLQSREDAAHVFRTSNIRAYQTNVELGFHGDGSDALFFLCVRQGKSGGTTRLSSALTAFNDVLAEDPASARILGEAFTFDARGELGEARPTQSLPIFAAHGGEVSSLYKRGYIELAQRLPGVEALSAPQIRALDALDRALASDKNCYEFQMQPGDILIANNYNIMHARTAFEDWPEPAPGRLMLRIWGTLRRNRRPIPPAYRETREFAESQARRVSLGDAVS